LTTNAVTAVISDYRRYRYVSIAANSWILDDSDLETLEMDPEYFYALNGYFFVVGFSTGSAFEGSL
jgi:hypothetical protein